MLEIIFNIQSVPIFVVDYGQNMELPLYNSEQPGVSNYYSPLSIYNLGVVNHSHEYTHILKETKNFKAHLHDHVYHEGIAKTVQKMLYDRS